MQDTPLKFDIIIFGATSFVGQILTRYMLAQFAVEGELKWAIAGRSQSKLNELKLSLGAAAETLDIVVADAADEDALGRRRRHRQGALPRDPRREQGRRRRNAAAPQIDGAGAPPLDV